MQVLDASLSWLQREHSSSDLRLMMVMGMPNAGKGVFRCLHACCSRNLHLAFAGKKGQPSWHVCHTKLQPSSCMWPTLLLRCAVSMPGLHAKCVVI